MNAGPTSTTTHTARPDALAAIASRAVALGAALLLACAILPARAAERTVSTVEDLRDAVAAAQPGDVITLAPGRYAPGKVRIRAPGHADAPVVLRAGALGEVLLTSTEPVLFDVAAPHWRFENLDIAGTCSPAERCEHAFHIVGDASGTTIRNSYMRDFNAMIKGNGIPTPDGRVFANDVLIEGNAFFNEAPRATANPVTYIDVVGGQRWIVRGNFFADFAKSKGNRVTYGAFFKGNSRDGLFDGNLVVCSWRHHGGTRVGLSFGGGGTAPDSVCEGGSCATEHRNGTMRNNVIMNCSDVGIYLNKAHSSRIYNNTLIRTAGIGARFTQTTAEIRNNIVSGLIRSRDGGSIRQSDNYVELERDQDAADLFEDVNRGDFRAKGEVLKLNRGAPLGGPQGDFCGNTRKAPPPTLGAVDIEGDVCDVAARLPKRLPTMAADWDTKDLSQPSAAADGTRRRTSASARTPMAQPAAPAAPGGAANDEPRKVPAASPPGASGDRPGTKPLSEPSASDIERILAALPSETRDPPGAVVLRVGPARPYKTPSAAAAAAPNGAVVLIDAGTYRGDAAVWRQNDLTIRADGEGRAHMQADGAHAEGKGIWVIKGDNVTIDGIEFSGAKVPDRNGAGIRQEGRNLTVRNSVFRDNENGILAADKPGSVITVERSEFGRNGNGDGLTHNIYVNHVDRLIVRYSYFHRAKTGHHVKSRARETFVLYSRLMDYVDGTSSYSVDAPEAGSVFIVGNILQQGPNTDNRAMINYGEEDDGYPGTHLYVVNNTMVNDRHYGRFITNSVGRKAVVANNLMAGRGLAVGGHGRADETNNLHDTRYDPVTGEARRPGLGPGAGSPSRFRNADKRDYALREGSSAIDAGGDARTFGGVPLVPRAEYVHPLSGRARPVAGVIDVGAFEFTAE